jgi:uncharacterized membrane protein
MPSFKDIAESVSMVIDALGVVVIAAGFVMAAYRFFLSRPKAPDLYRQIRQNIGHGILLGLEFLVAADIIRTVAVTPTMQGVLVLGLIVLIRTFLSMALQVELEGRWPWQQVRKSSAADIDLR